MKTYRFRLFSGKVIEIEAINYNEARILLYYELQHRGIVKVIK